MLRPILLSLSESKTLSKLFTPQKILGQFSKRFVAGTSLEDVISAVKNLNKKGILATADFLGENVSTEAEATKAMQEYLALLKKIHATKINSTVSVKLTQLGLDISYNTAFRNMKTLLESAAEYKNFVTIDMESSKYTTATLDIYKALKTEKFDNVGVVIQAYLKRSRDDIKQLIQYGANIRVCKGAYKEPPEIAFARKSDVNENFICILQMLFSEEARQKKVFVAVATHDEKIINWVKKYVKENAIGKDRYEFQMLYGIRTLLQESLAREGYTIRSYVPYGNHWYPYFMRRLAERPANLWFFIRHLTQF